MTEILIGDVSGIPGQSGVKVDVIVNTQGQLVTGVNINLGFDGAVLPGATAIAGPAHPGGWSFAENLAGPGDHRVVMLDLSGNGAAINGVLYTVLFDIDSEAPPGGVAINADLADIPDGEPITTVPGVVNVVAVVTSNSVSVLGLSLLIVSLAVTPLTVKDTVGTTQQLTAIATLEEGSTVDMTAFVGWNSSNGAVVTVDTNGLATITGAGNAVITATISPLP